MSSSAPNATIGYALYWPQTNTYEVMADTDPKILPRHRAMEFGDVESMKYDGQYWLAQLMFKGPLAEAEQLCKDLDSGARSVPSLKLPDFETRRKEQAAKKEKEKKEEAEKKEALKRKKEEESKSRRGSKRMRSQSAARLEELQEEAAAAVKPEEKKVKQEPTDEEMHKVEAASASTAAPTAHVKKEVPVAPKKAPAQLRKEEEDKAARAAAAALMAGVRATGQSHPVNVFAAPVVEPKTEADAPPEPKKAPTDDQLAAYRLAIDALNKAQQKVVTLEDCLWDREEHVAKLIKIRDDCRKELGDARGELETARNVANRARREVGREEEEAEDDAASTSQIVLPSITNSP